MEGLQKISTQKRGSLNQTPSEETFLTSGLEVEPHRELNLTHRAAIFKARDLTVVAARAIDTVRGQRIHRVVENVEEIRAELHIEPLVDGELLHYRHVRVESTRSMERVAPNVAQVAFCRIGKGARRIGRIRDVWDWGVKRQIMVNRVDTPGDSSME